MRKAVPALVAGFLLLVSGLFAHADELRKDNITLAYDPADAAVAKRSLEVVLETLDEFKATMPAGNKPITIALCHTHGEFRQYAGTLSRPGVGGVAEAQSGVMAVKAPGIQPPGADFEGILRHELIHLLLARNYNATNIPRWLNEGITMSLSGENRTEDRFLAGYMYVRGNLIGYNELPIALEASEYTGRLGEAYAQSLSMTEFLMKRLGKERFWQLIRAMDTQTFVDALQSVGGMSTEAFMQGWQRSLWKLALVFSLVSGFSAFQLMILLTFLAYWRKRRRGHALMRQWTEEEEEGETILFAHELEGREEPYPWEEEDEDRL
jgi:hypothetical protein